MHQIDHLVFVSNDCRPIHHGIIRLGLKHVTYVKNDFNVGLGSALNQGLRYLQSRNYQWCLLLDQDTEVDSNLIDELRNIYKSHPDKSSIGILAPNYRSSTGKRLAYKDDITWKSVPTVVTSGSLLKMEIINLIGYMREDFFIEGIDIEFCLRLRSSGFAIIASGRPLMTHSAGVGEEKKILGRTVLIGHHEPYRLFLQMQNLTHIIIHYGLQEPRWTCKTFIAVLKRSTLIMLFEQKKLEKLIAMSKGFLAGLSMRTCKKVISEIETKDPKIRS